jgi:hypothetical protein
MIENKSMPSWEVLPKRDMVLSSLIEQKTVLNACAKELVFKTQQEVNGVLGDKEIIENGALRDVVKKLAENVNEFPSPLELLYMGIVGTVPISDLQKWAIPSERPDSTKDEACFHKAAEYFFKKRQQTSLPR